MNAEAGTADDAAAAEHLLDVVIDRSRWLRGAPEVSTLRHPKSCHECCVGTIGRTAGIACAKLESHAWLAAIGESGIPDVLREFAPTLPGLARMKDPRAAANDRRSKPKLCSDLMYAINDDETLDDPTRERLLSEVAAQAGIRLRFTGTPLPPHAIAPSGDARARQAAISRGETDGRTGVRIRLATMRLDDRHEWQPLDETTVTLDSDSETTGAYVYDLVRAHAHEQTRPVRVTATEAAGGRTVADCYHEAV